MNRTSSVLESLTAKATGTPRDSGCHTKPQAVWVPGEPRPQGCSPGLVETRQVPPFVTPFLFSLYSLWEGQRVHACSLTHVHPPPSSGARALFSGSVSPASANTHRPVLQPRKPSPHFLPAGLHSSTLQGRAPISAPLTASLGSTLAILETQLPSRDDQNFIKGDRQFK